jgi:hypothetical protein
VKTLHNSSGIPDEVVRDVMSFIESELRVSDYDVELRSRAKVVTGRAWPWKSPLKGHLRPFVELGVGVDGESIARWLEETAEGKRWRGWVKKNPDRLRRLCHWPTAVSAAHLGRRVRLLNRTEALVYIAAHEIRHLWQEGSLKDNKSKPPPRREVKGKYSKKYIIEVDAENYSIRALKRWRKQNRKPLLTKIGIRGGV